MLLQEVQNAMKKHIIQFCFTRLLTHCKVIDIQNKSFIISTQKLGVFIALLIFSHMMTKIANQTLIGLKNNSYRIHKRHKMSESFGSNEPEWPLHTRKQRKVELYNQ